MAKETFKQGKRFIFFNAVAGLTRKTKKVWNDRTGQTKLALTLQWKSSTAVTKPAKALFANFFASE